MEQCEMIWETMEEGNDAAKRENVAEMAEIVDKTDKEEFEACREELRRLRALIADGEQKKREKTAFAELFPKVSPDDVPDSVREYAVAEGLPLVAAYAMYVCRAEREKGRIGDKLADSATRSSGSVENCRAEELFSIEQIRAMSPKEVRRHYKAVMKSLSRGKNR